MTDFVPLPRLANIHYRDTDGNGAEGDAFAVMTAGSWGWLVKPRSGLPGAVIFVPTVDVTRFVWEPIAV